MRILFLLNLCFLVVTQNSSSENKTIVDLLQAVIDTEHRLEEELKLDLAKAKQKRDEVKAEVSSMLNQTIEKLDKAIKEKVEAFREFSKKYDDVKQSIHQERIEKLREELDQLRKIGEAVKEQKEAETAKKNQKFHDLLSYLKNAYQKKQQEEVDKIKAEKEKLSQIIEKLKQKFNELRTKAQQAREAKEQERKEKIENLKTTLNDLKTLLKKEATEREEKKQERRDEIKEVMVGYKDELLNQKATLDAQTEELMNNLAEFQENKRQLINTAKEAIHEGIKATIEEKINDNLQKSLDKAAIVEVIREGISSENASGLSNIEPKGTILDEITGKSAWQTVTWILLGLCILLAVALIFMILYQISHRRNYQRLDGQNKSGEDESTPIAQNTAPLGYTNEKSLGHSGPPVLASPSVPPGETQQF